MSSLVLYVYQDGPSLLLEMSYPQQIQLMISQVPTQIFKKQKSIQIQIYFSQSIDNNCLL